MLKKLPKLLLVILENLVGVAAIGFGMGIVVLGIVRASLITIVVGLAIAMVSAISLWLGLS